MDEKPKPKEGDEKPKGPPITTEDSQPENPPPNPPPSGGG